MGTLLLGKNSGDAQPNRFGSLTLILVLQSRGELSRLFDLSEDNDPRLLGHGGAIIASILFCSASLVYLSSSTSLITAADLLIITLLELTIPAFLVLGLEAHVDFKGRFLDLGAGTYVSDLLFLSVNILVLPRYLPPLVL